MHAVPLFVRRAATRWTVAECLVLCAAAAGCGDLGPRDVDAAGTYTLRAVSGRTLPYMSWFTAGSGPHYIVADTLWLAATGSASRRQYESGRSGTSVYADSGTWAVHGSSVLLRWRSAYPTPSDTVTATVRSLAAGSAELRYTAPYTSAEYQYVR